MTITLLLSSVVLASTAVSQEPPKLAFEVASIKQSKGAFTPPSFPLDAGDAFVPTGGLFNADFPLVVYITFAYKLWLTPGQMQAMTEHLPKWVASDRFAIHARAEGNPTKDQIRQMMQSLLADRFQMQIHFETKTVPLFALTLIKPGKLGPNLRPHDQGPPCDAPPSAEVFPPRCDVYAMMRLPNRPTRSGSRNTTMDLLASSLAGFDRLTRPVINQTGLTGRYDFFLEWTPDPIGTPPPDADPGPTFLEALREQLGLKLESTTGPIKTLIVDRIERPTEN